MFKTNTQVNYFLLIFIFLFSCSMAIAEDEAEGEGAADNEAEYYELTPPFVVNLQDSGSRVRFLQTRIQVLAYGKTKIDAVKKHDAPIRDALITLLSSQSRSDIKTSKQKKELQEQALKTVQKVLKDETGRPQVDGLYFTTFVIQ